MKTASSRCFYWVVACTLVALWTVASSACRAESSQPDAQPAGTVLDLWSSEMPGERAAEPEASDYNAKQNALRVSYVSKPTLELFLAKASEPTPLIIVCPGGGYRRLSYNKEGTEVGEWLNSIGVSAAVLKYRVPESRSGALEDARRAVRMAREKSKAWNVSPKGLGMLGFSAGGHLTAACSNSADRPDFAALIYPAYLFKKGGTALTDEIKVDANTPPTFLVQTHDDKKYYRSTLAYAAALDAHKVPLEVHLFAKGGHGYGLRPSRHPVSKWPKLCESWLRETGVLTQ